MQPTREGKPRILAGAFFAGLAAVLLLGPACASTPQSGGGGPQPSAVPPPPAQEDDVVYRETAEEQFGPRPAPEFPATSIEDELDPAFDPGRTYELNVRDADIRAVLMAIARDSDLSIVIEPEVEGQVTQDIRNVTLPVLLKSLLDPLNLGYRVEDGVLRISAKKMETRFFFVDIVQTDRSGQRSVSVSTGQRGGAAGGGFTGGGGAGAGGAGGGGGLTGGGGQASVQSDDPFFVWDEIEQGIVFLMGAGGVGGGGRGLRDFREDDLLRTGFVGAGQGFEEEDLGPALHVNRTAGTVMVRHLPEILDKIGEYLEMVEQIVQRQVLIEAQIVEVILREEFSAGVDWSALLRDVGLNISQSMAVAGSNIFQLQLTRDDVTAVLSALENQGEVNVLSSPSTVTMNNQTALLTVGTQEVFFTTNTIIDPTTGRVISVNSQPSTVTAGVILSVTPQVSADGWVTMSVQPAITERTGEAVSREGDRFPIMDVRVTDNMVRVRDGKTIFIGGLLEDILRKTETQTPILGDLPGVGFLFRRTDVSNRKSDLIIMITPTILNESRIRELMREQVQRIETRRRTRPESKNIFRR